MKTFAIIKQMRSSKNRGVSPKSSAFLYLSDNSIFFSTSAKLM
jgi:hypothetical protein